ncbi:MAG: 50S ribosomal protein L24 [Planctomycetia bacterium]|nr:50S ribosomal protein L24 [Planctomycetia bacterium]
MHIRRDDTVEVIAGEDKGVRARVLQVDAARGRVIVEGVNRVFKHLRKSQRHPQGGRLEKEASLDASNVLVVCSECNRGVRSGWRRDESGAKRRVCRRCGSDLGRR